MTDDASTKARSKCLAIPEILVSILYHRLLNGHTEAVLEASRLRRVSCCWQGTIDTSPTLSPLLHRETFKKSRCGEIHADLQEPFVLPIFPKVMRFNLATHDFEYLNGKRVRIRAECPRVFLTVNVSKLMSIMNGRLDKNPMLEKLYMTQPQPKEIRACECPMKESTYTRTLVKEGLSMADMLEFITHTTDMRFAC